MSKEPFKENNRILHDIKGRENPPKGVVVVVVVVCVCVCVWGGGGGG